MAKTEKKIIQMLALYPYKEFYGQEIAKKVKCSKGSASMILKSLAGKKIVFQKRVGNMKFYQINNDNPIVSQFKINLVLEKLGTILAKLKEISAKVILFGSAARGEQTIDSDIDLFILSKDKNKVLEIIKKSKKISSPIKPIIKNQNEWSEMEVNDPEFYKEIKRGITLHDYVSRI